MANPMERNPFIDQGGGGNNPLLGELPINEEEIEIELPVGEDELLEYIMGTEEQPYNHWDNLALSLDEDELLEIANNVIEEFDADKESRSEWESTFERGFDLLGLKLQETSEPFEGACTAVHPLIIESAVKFQAKASQELFPAKGPVRTQILGASTPEKEKQANRVMNFMNYQLTQQMPEYFDETERMLFNLPVFGSAFKKTYYDLTLERPVVEFVPIDNFYVSYNASDLKNADHYTQVIYRTPNDLKKDIMAGMYALPEDDNLMEPSEVTPSTLRQKMDSILGIQPDYSQNPQHTLLEHHCYLKIEHRGEEGCPCPMCGEKEIDNCLCVGLPYVITVDQDSKSVLSIRRNWNENDPLKEKLLWFTHYRFVPGFGFYGLGYIHFLGNLTATSTAAMRNLIDAGQFATLPGGFKARGVRVTGGDEPIAPGEFREVEATGVDLNKAIINLPYKEPSATLMQMLQFVTTAGQKFADETDQVVSDASNYGPVGTTVALIEQSMKFFSGIHKRLHYSQRQELQILSRINYDFLPEEYPYDIPLVDGSIFKQDFDGRVDIIPVTDPNIPSSSHRLAQAQMIMQLASQAPPGIYNFKAVNNAILDAINIDHPERFIVPDKAPQPLDPVSDIQQSTNGMPIKAFPGQDHKAHIVIKTSFIEDPTLGQNPIMSKVVPLLQANIREHMILQYQEQMGGMLKMGTEQAGTGSPEAISAITQGAAQEILQNNQRMAEMGTTESLEKQTLELQKQQLELESHKTRIDAAESAADVALDKQKMKFDYEKENSKAALEREKIKLEYLELEVEKKKIAVESSEKLAKISEDDKHKTLDRDDNFLIEILKIIMKETGITVTKLKKNINLTPEQTSRLTETESKETEKFAEGGFTAKAADPISGNPAAPPIWAEGYQPEQVATTLPVDNTADTSTPELIKESVSVPTVGDWEQLDQAIANISTSGEQLPLPELENVVDTIPDIKESTNLILANAKEIAGESLVIPEGGSVDIGQHQINSRWVGSVDDKSGFTKHDTNRPGVYADKAIDFIDNNLKELEGDLSVENILTLPEEERLQLLRDNDTINEAYAKGIYEAWGLKRWAKQTRDRVYRDLKREKGLTRKEVNNLSFEEISPYIIRHESGGKQAMNINKPSVS